MSIRDDRILRQMLERYADDRDDPTVLEKSSLELESFGTRSDVDSIIGFTSSDSTTNVLIVTIPSVVEVLKDVSCVVLSSVKQMRALVDIKHKFGYEGTYGVVRDSRDMVQIDEMAMWNEIPKRGSDVLPPSTGGRQGGRPSEDHQGRRRRRRRSEILSDAEE